MMKKLNEENYVGEIWKDIKGYERLYQVSNFGRVKSLVKLLKTKGGALRKTNERILNPFLSHNGYQRVFLCKNGKHKFYYVHRLVYEAFIGEIPEGMQVNHKDENKQNNILSNIDTLMSPKANMNWGTCIERSTKARSKTVVQKTLQGEVIKVWGSTREIERELGYTNQNISYCCRGGHYNKGKWVNCTQSYGYRWEYVEGNTN